MTTPALSPEQLEQLRALAAKWVKIVLVAVEIGIPDGCACAGK